MVLGLLGGMPRDPTKPIPTFSKHLGAPHGAGKQVGVNNACCSRPVYRPSWPPLQKIKLLSFELHVQGMVQCVSVPLTISM